MQRYALIFLATIRNCGDAYDDTRKPEWYDGVYNYLKEIGLSEI